MAFSRFVLVSMAVVLCVSMSADLSAGQVPAPSPGLACSDELVELLPCLDFLTNSNATLVSPGCCGGLTNVSVSSPLCLCQFISANQSAQMGINETRALELPSFCHLNINPGSCNAAMGPVVAPVPSMHAPKLAPVPIVGPPIIAPALAPAVTTPPTSPTSSPGTPGENCTTVEGSLIPCMQYLTGADPSPTKVCCTNLGDAVKTSAGCLCSLVSSNPASSVVNVTLALRLPAECNVHASLDQCSASAPGPAEGPGINIYGGNTGTQLEAALRPVTVIALAVAMVAYYFCNDVFADGL